MELLVASEGTAELLGRAPRAGSSLLLVIEPVDTSDLWLLLPSRNTHLLYRNILAFLFEKERLIKSHFTYFL